LLHVGCHSPAPGVNSGTMLAPDDVNSDCGQQDVTEL